MNIPTNHSFCFGRAALVTAALLGLTSHACAIELLVNGDFETGTLAGWAVTDQAGGSGSWFANPTAAAAPLSGLATLGGPPNATTIALSDQSGPGAHALEQVFVVPAGATSVTLSFDMFVNDWDGGPFVDPAGLDYTAVPNQHGRVDILAFGSPSLGPPVGVLANFYLGVDPGADPNPFVPYVFDITALVAGGGPFVLRFAEVDNQLFFNMGVDNVSIDYVPEPGTFMLAGLGLVGLCWVARRRRALEFR
jgi:hypothetical protein